MQGSVYRCRVVVTLIISACVTIRGQCCMFARCRKGSHLEHLVCDPVGLVTSEHATWSPTGFVFYTGGGLNLWREGALQHPPRPIAVWAQSTVSCHCGGGEGDRKEQNNVCLCWQKSPVSQRFNSWTDTGSQLCWSDLTPPKFTGSFPFLVIINSKIS